MSSPDTPHPHNLREGQTYHYSLASGTPLSRPERQTLTVSNLTTFADDGIVLVSDLNGTTFPISAYSLTQSGHYHLQPPSVLPKSFSPGGFQWQHNHKVLPLSTLSHDDLLQVACSLIHTLEEMDLQLAALTNLMENFRTGNISPDPSA